jgi:hypothetical protein
LQLGHLFAKILKATSFQSENEKNGCVYVPPFKKMTAHDDVESQSLNFESSQWITPPSQVKSPVEKVNKVFPNAYRISNNLAQTKGHVFGESSLHRQPLDIGLCGGALVSQQPLPWGAPLKLKIM